MSNSKKTAAGCGNIRKKIIRRGGKEYQYEKMFLVVLFAGIREGEVCGLQ